ncbi:hypothetical protein [Saccharothrix sp. NRRL B-16314]|uniref:hypothetical protein n=1 Tax=Saccharothrix sp. NRRL B-16314 TaxID=1463825 RepID=UPI0012DF2A1D|nr:hypothetical protein [Saccharothrix sp. NRRL B-16314]
MRAWTLGTMPPAGRLDLFIPEWDAHEVHRLRIDAARDLVMTTVAEVAGGEPRPARVLPPLIGNRLPGGEPIVDTFGGLAGAPGEQPDEFVFGAIDPMTDDAPTTRDQAAGSSGWPSSDQERTAGQAQTIRTSGTYSIHLPPASLNAFSFAMISSAWFQANNRA